jgi:GrpB-like predicted nucleotidyltransferase (UPF0157 family)
MWPREFVRVAKFVTAPGEAAVCDIEDFGSASVPGVAAEPIVEIY